MDYTQQIRQRYKALHIESFALTLGEVKVLQITRTTSKILLLFDIAI